MILNKEHEFQRVRTYENVREFQRVRTYENVREFSAGQNRGKSAPKPVKTKTRDESCPVSIVEGASCPISKLRDQI